MSTKDFKQGMVAGAKPFGDKLDQLANVSECAVSDINAGIAGVNSVVNCILDDLSIQEKKAVYDLDTPQGITELDQTEKEYLLSVLFSFADQKGQVNDQQKFYLRTLKAYLGIPNIQVGIDLGTIENIESITFQKIILQTLMEFLYLEYQSHEYIEDYEGLFDTFSVNKRGIKELQSSIDHMASLMGIEGIACHYSPLAEPEVIEETLEEMLTEDDSVESDAVPSALVPNETPDYDVSTAILTKPCKKFAGNLYMNTKAEGGRNVPIFSNYMPQFCFESTTTTGIITLPENVELCMPGDTVCATVELKARVNLTIGTCFTVVDGTKKDIKTVGIGTVTEIIE